MNWALKLQLEYNCVGTEAYRRRSKPSVRLASLGRRPGTSGKLVPSKQPGGMTKRILIIDDNVDSAESLALLFRLSGHEVMAFAEGTRAVIAAGPFQPHLVLLDIGLPDINGYEVARRLRKSGCTAVMVAVTGYGQADDVKRAHEAGFDAHCLKPVDPVELERFLT